MGCCVSVNSSKNHGVADNASEVFDGKSITNEQLHGKVFDEESITDLQLQGGGGEISQAGSVERSYNSFEQFDVVVDCSDHQYCSKPVRKPQREWVTRIQREWKLLQNDLPETIYVRAYEGRMDILRAAIAGPPGTPYYGGLFFFDVLYPRDYPYTPPLVHHHSWGLRINPNLYSCGTVCLSLLGTWNGSGCEKWDQIKSSILQVLISIQALVLNEKPYFNEPGYARSANTMKGEKNSIKYNEKVFLLSCKMMLHSLRKPPKHFEDLVAEHFLTYGPAILRTCRAYIAGVQVGSNIEAAAIPERNKISNSGLFRSELGTLYKTLLNEFAANGVDCAELLDQKS